MYEDYYRFRRQPFSPTPDPEFLYKSDSHQKALEELLRGIRRREGMVLLTGDVGTGKTTTTRALLHLLDRDVFTAQVVNPFVTAEELLRVLLQDFGVVSDTRVLQDASRQSLVDTLNRFLLSLSAIGASALVVVDEAQNLAPPALEQLRVLTTLETDQQKLLQVLLVGQPELQQTLESAEMRALNQRIARRCSLGPLNRDEVEKYVTFRIRMARGAGETMFSERALDLVHEFSGGVPRKINLLCDRSLEVGFAALSPTVDETLVAKAAAALKFTRDPALPVSASSVDGRGSRRVSPHMKRWLAAAAGIVAGVGIGAALTVLVPSLLPVGPSVGPPPTLATLDLPRPVVFAPDAGLPADPAYRIYAGAFDTRPSAEAMAAMVTALGADAAVAPAAGESGRYLVWVGPYASLDSARLMEATIARRFAVRDTRIVAK